MREHNLATNVSSLDTLVTIQEAAIFFAVHPLTVWRMIRSGELAAFKGEDGIWCMLRDDIADYCGRMKNI